MTNGGHNLAAVVFDLDGVLIESEPLWAETRREVTLAAGGHWPDEAVRRMQGMSSSEWSAYMHDELDVADAPERIVEVVVERMAEALRRRLPLLPGAREAVGRIAACWPLAIASSSNRPLIKLVLDLASLRPHFAAIVSSEEVARGKPAPDVYLEAAARLGVDAQRCVAIEDSSNGLRSAHAAGMGVIAVQSTTYPAAADALALAADVVHALDQLTVERVRRAAPTA